jgi:O-antigen ligase
MSNRRRLLIFAIALVLLCGSLVTVFSTREAAAEARRGVADPTVAAALPYRVPLVGINADLIGLSESAAQAELTAMREMGIVWVRTRVLWSAIEREPGVFDWQAVDSVAAAFAAVPGVRWVPVLVGAPGFHIRAALAASPRFQPLTAPPEDPAAFARFARAFAARYAAQAAAYQVWDEPNITLGWGGDQPRPAEYAALLEAGYTALHDADADAHVIAAALAPTLEESQDNTTETRFLRDLFALGAGRFMDAAAGKPYGFSSTPADRTVRPDLLGFSRFITLREVMEAAGYGHLALWGSEGGWNALPAGWAGEPSAWGGVPEDALTGHVAAAYARAAAEWPWVGGLILQSWKPALPAEDARWGFALHTPAGEQRPVAHAYPAASALPLAGRYPAANPDAEYIGVWTFGPLGADIGWVNDSALTFRFTGSRVAVLVRRGDYSAFLYPSLDRAAPNRLPRSAEGHGFIALTSPDLAPEVRPVLIADGLPVEPHTLTVHADRGWDRWALAGFAVGTAEPDRAADVQVNAAVFAAAVAGVAAAVSAASIRWRPVFAWLGRLIAPLGAPVQLALSGAAALALMVGVLLTWGGPVPGVFRREPVQFGLALLTAGLLYLSPWAAVAIAAALILWIVSFHRPVWGAGFVLFFAPFYLFPVELYRFAFPMSELLTLILASAAAVRAGVEWARARQAGRSIARELPTLHALDGLAAAYLLLGIFGIATADLQSVAVTEWRVLFAEPLMLIGVLVAAAVVVCGVGLVQFVRGEAIITAEGGARRLASVYGSPNNAALFLGRALPFAFAFALFPAGRQWRVGGALAAGLLLVTLALTQSAGGLLLGAPAGLLAVLAFRFGRRAAWALAGLPVLAAGGVVLAGVSERFARLFSLNEGTNFFRLRVWQSALDMIADRPLTGFGLDQFLYAYRSRYLLPDAWQEPNLSHPHHLVLDHWLRLGLPGVIWLIALHIVFWRALLGRFRAAGSALERACWAGAGGAMSATIAHGLVDNSLFVSDLAFVFFFLLALTASGMGEPQKADRAAVAA